LIAANVYLGLEEIQAEDSTHDGSFTSMDAANGLIHAADGLRVGGGSKPILNAFRSGVLTSISTPKGRGIVHGLSVAFSTGAQCKTPL
jgi:hypothetical protein